MKRPHPRTYFFAALVLLVAFQAAALGQAKTSAPIVATPTPPTATTHTPYGDLIVKPPSVEENSVEWREFKSEAGGFSVKFPGVPRVEHVSFNKGPVELVRHTHTASLGDAAQ